MGALLCCLVAQSCPTLCPHELQHTQPPCPSPSPWVCSNLCPLSQWHHPNISSCVAPFSSCPQSFPASGSFAMNRLFTPGGQSIGTSASASVPPVNIQGWLPLGLTGLISLLPWVSQVSSSVPQLESIGSSALSLLWSNPHICAWPLGKPELWQYGPLSAKQCLCAVVCCPGWS